jgi:hypothetical protein
MGYGWRYGERVWCAFTDLCVIRNPVCETPWDCDGGVAVDVVGAEVFGGSTGSSFEEGLTADAWS